MMGASPPRAQELTRTAERLSFIYLEHCVVHREDSAITATDSRGTVHIPVASLGALLLGPGTRVTHHAMMLLGECSATAVWVGERGVRYYAHGTSLARSARLTLAQAELVSNRHKRLEVARQMYSMRFPDEDVADLTMQQLRGKEGARVRRIYRQHADRTGVFWQSRRYDPQNFEGSDPINQALSAAHACLYGIVHAVVVSLGCVPGLGFVHTGHSRAFVYDIADLYKAQVTIPVAFDVVAESEQDVAGRTRRAVRQQVRDGKLMQQCAQDVQRLLLPHDLDESEWYADVISLWGEDGQLVEAGQNYGES